MGPVYEMVLEDVYRKMSVCLSNIEQMSASGIVLRNVHADYFDFIMVAV